MSFLGSGDHHVYCILNNNNVNRMEDSSLDLKHSIDSGQQTFVFVWLVVQDKFVKHVRENALFISTHSFNYKFLVVGKEEKRSALAGSLAWLHDLIKVLIVSKWFLNVWRLQTIHFNDFKKLFWVVRANRRYDIEFPSILIFLINFRLYLTLN